MNCKKCHSQLPQNAKFCPQCGEKIVVKHKDPARKVSTSSKESSPLVKKSNAYTFILFAVIAAFVVIVLVLNSNKKEIIKVTNEIESNTLDSSDEIKVLSEKLLKNPESLTLNIEMGNKLFDAGQFNQSVSYYKKALTLDPGNISVQIDLGVCYFNMQDFDNAILEMDKALNLDPEHQKGLFNMGVIYLNAGNIEETKKYWNRLKILHPQSREAQRAQEILDSM